MGPYSSRGRSDRNAVRPAQSQSPRIPTGSVRLPTTVLDQKTTRPGNYLLAFPWVHHTLSIASIGALNPTGIPRKSFRKACKAYAL